MPTVKVVDLVTRAGILLNDTAATRWTKQELLSWFNDAQRELVFARPDLKATYASFSCAAGTKQSLPSTALRLITVQKNTSGNQRAVTQVARNLLDNHLPSWHKEPQSDEVEHFVYDPMQPKVFWVYPPAQAALSIDIVYGANPTLVTSAQTDLSDITTTTIEVDDIYANALLDYMLYRAYAKDTNIAGSGQRATMHLQLFQQAVGVKVQVDTAMTPAPRPERGPS